MNYEEYEKFLRFREYYKVPMVNMEQVEKKSMDIYDARNYIYKVGEADKIANKKFDKAL
jgi:hypothetical protein